MRKKTKKLLEFFVTLALFPTFHGTIILLHLYIKAKYIAYGGLSNSATSGTMSLHAIGLQKLWKAVYSNLEGLKMESIEW